MPELEPEVTRPRRPSRHASAALVAIGIAGGLALVTAVWFAGARSNGSSLTVAAPTCDEPAAPPEPEEPPPPPPPEPAVTVLAGACDTSLLPPGMVEPVSPADSAALRELVAAWLTDDTARDRPSIVARRGVLFVESEEDRGDDPPSPRAAAPEAERACGSAATWLRSHLRDQLARLARGGDLTCDGNVCCYPDVAVEYSPIGLVVFQPVSRDGATVWTLDAWAQWYSAALGRDYAAANVRFVRAALRRESDTRCAGEPAFLY